MLMGSLNTDTNNGISLKPTFISADTITNADGTVTKSNLKFGTAVKSKFTASLLAKTTYKFTASIAVTSVHTVDANKLKLNLFITDSKGKSLITNGFVTRSTGVTQKGVRTSFIKYEGYITPAKANPEITIQVTEANKRQIKVSTSSMEFARVKMAGSITSTAVNAKQKPATSASTAVVIKAKKTTTATDAKNPSAVTTKKKP